MNYRRRSTDKLGKTKESSALRGPGRRLAPGRSRPGTNGNERSPTVAKQSSAKIQARGGYEQYGVRELVNLLSAYAKARSAHPWVREAAEYLQRQRVEVVQRMSSVDVLYTASSLSRLGVLAPELVGCAQYARCALLQWWRSGAACMLARCRCAALVLLAPPTLAREQRRLCSARTLPRAGGAPVACSRAARKPPRQTRTGCPPLVRASLVRASLVLRSHVPRTPPSRTDREPLARRLLVARAPLGTCSCAAWAPLVQALALMRCLLAPLVCRSGAPRAPLWLRSRAALAPPRTHLERAGSERR